MINQPNNILSYFIKDIKDAKELVFYKQIKINDFIQIVYKNKLLYRITKNFFSNYINNRVKDLILHYVWNYKIRCNYRHNYKCLFYKKDNKLNSPNPNRISFTYKYYKYNKYFNKIRFSYISNDKFLLFILIIYYNKYKYIKNYKDATYKNKFTSPKILIINKYELDYSCKFFNLYLANNY